MLHNKEDPNKFCHHKCTIRGCFPSFWCQMSLLLSFIHSFLFPLTSRVISLDCVEFGQLKLPCLAEIRLVGPQFHQLCFTVGPVSPWGLPDVCEEKHTTLGGICNASSFVTSYQQFLSDPGFKPEVMSMYRRPQTRELIPDMSHFNPWVCFKLN